MVSFFYQGLEWAIVGGVGFGLNKHGEFLLSHFVIKSNNEKCGIVDMSDGSFKVVLIWTGVNVDVFFR